MVPTSLSGRWSSGVCWCPAADLRPPPKRRDPDWHRRKPAERAPWQALAKRGSPVRGAERAGNTSFRYNDTAARMGAHLKSRHETLFHSEFDPSHAAAHHGLGVPLGMGGPQQAGIMTDRPASERPPRKRLAPLGLSGKLLVLTTLFVMIAEVLIYVPSIASFRLTWLQDRLSAAYTAVLVLDAAPSGMVPETLTRQILDSIGARAVAMKTEHQRRLLAASEMPPPMFDHEVDVRAVTWHRAVIDAFDTMVSRKNSVIRAVGPAPMGGQ